MKILFVINSMNMGGAEKLLVESIPFYERNNINVDVLVLVKNPSLPLWKDLQSKTKGKIWGLTSKSVYNPLLIFSLIKVFRNYSAVHVHLFPALYWSVLAKLFSASSIRMFYTEHSTHNKRREKWYFKVIDKFIYSFLEKIIVISKDVHINLIQHLGDKFDEKMLLIPNGIDLLKFRDAEAYPKNYFFDDDCIIITQVSNFRYPKDQKTILRALSKLDDKIKVLFIGTGENLEDCKQYSKEIGVSDRVKFLGLRNDVPQILKSSDILTLSSAYEGLSLSNIEGMSAGKAFVATNVPGIREVVDGYGLLFDYQDDNGFIQHVNSLISNPEYYEKISKMCQLRSDDFNINNMVLSYIRTYEKD